MHKGDKVIVDHPERDTNALIRTYGVVLETTEVGNVLIELADGSVIKRTDSSVAVYIQSPENWQELYAKQKITFARPTRAFATSRSKPSHRNN